MPLALKDKLQSESSSTTALFPFARKAVRTQATNHSSYSASSFCWSTRLRAFPIFPFDCSATAADKTVLTPFFSKYVAIRPWSKPPKRVCWHLDLMVAISWKTSGHKSKNSVLDGGSSILLSSLFDAAMVSFSACQIMTHFHPPSKDLRLTFCMTDKASLTLITPCLFSAPK